MPSSHVKPRHGLHRRGFLAAGTAAAAALMLPRSAMAGTQLSWIGWQGYDEPLKAGDFLKDNDIDLSTTYIGSNEEIITKLQAGGAGQLDLISIYFGHIPILAGAGLIEPIDEARVPGIDKIFPDFLDIDTIRMDGKLYAVPFTWGTLSMIYDPNAIAKPVSWNDCLKDEYKGKVSLTDDITGLITTWAPIVTGTKTPTRLTAAQLKETIDFLIKIKREHARTLSPNYGEATDLYARGEVVISAIGWDAQVAFAADKGKELAFVRPQEGVMVFMDTLAVPSGAPNRDAAYKALAQAISAAGQTVLASDLTQAVVNSDAVPLVDDVNRDVYQYGDFENLFRSARFDPFWPLQDDGEYASYDQVQEEYQRFLRA
ncbi:extracellular solute-binding protein [Mesorhizobium sp. Z1-4]|uniref:ABC transporter substrate-binding protein n=1 Tax=Mesorhizobium sp. Z1-4 TaxID=2448478 RepID=UPI0013E0B890|nr:extracellular solute-binding protein [Mesorhizobium sp. Z1-4]